MSNLSFPTLFGAALVLTLCVVELPAQKKKGGGSTPPPAPAIAFAASGIKVMNADGSNVRTVVALRRGESAGFPCWSPDGQQLAFNGVLGGQRGIWRVNLDGSGLQFLAPQANHLGLFNRLDWSRVPAPDGRHKILFPSDDVGGKPDLFVVNVDGTGLQNLTNSPGVTDKNGCWTRDATGICYGTWDGSTFPSYHAKVLTLGPAASGGIEVTAMAVMLDGWVFGDGQMAHGSDVLLLCGGPTPSPTFAIFAVDITVLPWSPRMVYGNREVQYAPSFSPDDQRMVMRRQGNGPDAGIFTANADGSGLVRIYGSSGYMPAWRHN